MLKLSKPTYLKRIIISYTIIFIIPLLVFSYIFQFSYLKILEDALITNTQRNLTSFQATVEKELNQLEMTVNQVIISKGLLPFEFENNPLSTKERINELKPLVNTNPFVSEMLLFYNDSRFIYSPSSSYILESNFNNVYTFPNWPVSQMIVDLTNRETRLILPSEPLSIFNKAEVEHYTVFAYPLSYSGVEYYGALLFLVNENTLRDIINTIYDSTNNHTLIIDSNSEVIISNQTDDFIKNTDLSSSIDLFASKSVSKIVNIEGIDYLITSSYNENYQWTFLNITSVDVALSKAKSTQHTFLLFTLATIFISIVVSIFLLVMNYTPIVKLRNMAQKVIKENSYAKLGDLDSIEHALFSLSKENASLSEVIDDHKIAAKSYLISQLLSGQPLKSEHLERESLSKITDPHMNKYFTLIINVVQEEHLWSDMKLELIVDIEETSTENITIMCMENVAVNGITALVMLNDSYEERINNHLTNMLENIKNKWKAEVTIGVGYISQSLSNLPKSYMGASTAIDYRLMVGTGSLIYYNDIIANMNFSSTYQHSSLDLFTTAIKKGNIEDINSILNNLVNQFTSNSIPIFVARGICYEIITCAFNTLKEAGYNYDNSIINKYPDIFSLTKYESISKIIEIIKLISYDVCKSLNMNYDNDHKILISNMNKYIETNYTDTSFSLQAMADHFNTLPSNLSTFYKENTGKKIFEIVTILRMDAAKNLLTESRLPINQICTKIGYDNVSSFIRRFKQFTGITPGNYRNLNN